MLQLYKPFRFSPLTQEVLNGAGVEIQLAAAASFLTILQDDIILIHTHTYCILKTVLLHLHHRDTGRTLAVQVWVLDTHFGCWMLIDWVVGANWLNGKCCLAEWWLLIGWLLHTDWMDARC